MKAVTKEGMVISHIVQITHIIDSYSLTPPYEKNGFEFNVSFVGGHHSAVWSQTKDEAEKIRDNLVKDIEEYWSDLACRSRSGQWDGGPK